MWNIALPKEHGAWAVLIVPILLGQLAVGGAPAGAVLAFWGAALGAFLLRTPLLAYLRQPSNRAALGFCAAYGLAAAAGLAALVGVYDRVALAAFAAPGVVVTVMHLRATLKRQALSLSNEALGIAGLTLGAPAAVYAFGGGLDSRAWGLWALNAMYFLGPIFHVKLAALGHRASVDPRALPLLPSARRRSLAYHSLAAAAAGTLAFLGIVPPLAGFALLAPVYKAAMLTRQEPSKVSFSALGYREVGHSAFFLALVALAYRLG